MLKFISIKYNFNKNENFILTRRESEEFDNY